MRLVEVRLLDGPNVYRLEPAVKVEVALGRQRAWTGSREPRRGGSVRLGASVRPSAAPTVVRDLRAWILALHRLGGADGWLERAGAPGRRARLPVAVHRASDPGHWVVAFPWRERGRAEAIANAAAALAGRGLAPRAVPAPRQTRSGGWIAGRGPGGRLLARALAAVGSADTAPPAWIRDAQRRMPVVSISGTNGKSTTTRMTAHILRMAGRHVGATTSDGVLLDDVLVEEGDLTGPQGARRVLRDPLVEVAVLETARGGLLLRGLGYESNDAAVLTNVSADHLDRQGLHTLPELAEVKAVIARVTRADGIVVLNAEDELVAGVARNVRARVCLFAVAPGRGRGGARVRRHLARGGLALVVEDGSIVEREGPTKRRPIVAVEDVPATLQGLARHNVANALAAAAAARALGASLEEVARGLRDYAPSPEMAPGRLNLYHRGERVVIVDYAHNEAGLAAALDVARRLAGGGWVSVVVGTAGDRPDDALRGMGRIAAERADAVAIKESLDYLRGRSRASLVAALRAGMVGGGWQADAIPVYEDEAAALRAELTDEARVASGPGPGVLLLTCHGGRAAVERTLADLGFGLLSPAELRALRAARAAPAQVPSA